MPTETDKPKVVWLDPARRDEEVEPDRGIKSLELAEAIVEICKAERVEHLVVLMQKSDGTVENAWTDLERRDLIWLLESTKMCAFEGLLERTEDEKTPC